VPEAAGVLARAFADNPGVLAVLDRHPAGARRTAFERISLGFLQAARQYGSVTAAVEQDRLAGVMLVYPPAAYPVPMIGQWLMAKPVLATGPRATWKFSCMASHMRRVHLRTRHYFLFMIGIDPEDQGKGYGGRLLRRLNDLADRAGVDCYLETDKRESVSLYEHFGYRITRDDTIPALGNLRMWTMTRPSR
jgi:ribosomal protein S18 acetylase RimI-like enzyme